MSIHRLLTQDRNLLASAISSATHPRPASAVRKTAASRAGNGRPRLSGPYTGADDTQIEVEVLAGGGTPGVSTPVPSGVGTGTLSDHTALAGATSQTYTIELIDTGTETAAAFVDIEGVKLVAQAAGALGNSIRLSVDQSGLVFTATDFSLLEPLAKDTTEATGPGWDWDTAVQFGEQIPTGAKRLVIGDDRSVIYRQWKVYEDGQWKYRFLPAIAREYRAGERVYEVTGSRVCTLTDGATPETYTSVITLYDLLSKIRAASALVEVDGIISETATADNLAAVLDLRTRSDARVDWTSGEGSAHARGYINHSAGANASTEIVTARCYANTRQSGGGIGQELWTLKGSVSGDLGVLRTGEAYTHPTGKFSLRIPTRLPDGYGEPRGDISSTLQYGPRSGDNPPICVDRLRLGPNAEDKAIKYIYTERPSNECACEGTDWIRLAQSEQCLGLDATEEDDDVSNAMATGHAVRLRDVQQWHADFVAANTQLSSNAELRSATHDIGLADAIRNILLAALARLYGDGIRSWTAWAAAASISVDEVREPAPRNGYKYRAQGAGTTGASAPVWPTTLGATVVDNGITWECIGKIPEHEFDDLLSAIDTDLTALEAIETDYTDIEAVPLWAGTTAYSRGDLVRSTLWTGSTSTSDPYSTTILVCVDGGTSENIGATQPSIEPGGGSFGSLVSDGSVLWMSLGSLPFWSNADINDPAQASSGISFSVDDFVNRYGAQADYVLAQAEIVPDFNRASGTGTNPGGSCWQDPGDTYWWVPEGYAYMPAFTNREYVSIIRSSDPDATDPYQPTHEFGFVIKVECTGDLVAGDAVTIHIGDAGWPATYLVGDRLHMATLAAASLYLSGGVTGNDQHTWRVHRSVDGIGANYVQNLTVPNLYNDGDVTFRLNPGGIAHQVGDRWTFCVSADAWQWRQDGGAWNGPFDIGASGSLPDGLSVAWEPGACPAYVADDSAAWDVIQPYALDHSASPSDEVMGWDGVGTVITDQITGTVDTLGLLWHELAEGAVVQVSDGAGLNETLPWREGPMLLCLATALINPTLTWTISGAGGGLIHWRWAGEGLSLAPRVGEHPQAQMASLQVRRRQWSVQRGESLNPGGLPVGSGWGYELDWPFQTIYQEHMDDLLAAIDAHKAAGSRPAVFIPNMHIPAEAALVALPDQVELEELGHYEDTDPADRKYRLRLELAPWLI